MIMKCIDSVTAWSIRKKLSWVVQRIHWPKSYPQANPIIEAVTSVISNKPMTKTQTCFADITGFIINHGSSLSLNAADFQYFLKNFLMWPSWPPGNCPKSWSFGTWKLTDFGSYREILDLVLGKCIWNNLTACTKRYFLLFWKPICPDLGQIYPDKSSWRIHICLRIKNMVDTSPFTYHLSYLGFSIPTPPQQNSVI